MDRDNIVIEPIANIYTPMKQKFGVPRQSGMVEELRGRIVFKEGFRRAEALKGIEGFSHLWLIWHFSQAESWSFSVRPPRLGGNTKVGVFASRSPYRPNHIGLSCVRLIGIERECVDAPVLLVGGVDMIDGTAIFDIKPYVPFADCINEASNGYTVHTQEHRLSVILHDELKGIIPADKQRAIIDILSYDPRPGYDDDGEKYGMAFDDMDIGFYVIGNVAYVERVTFTQE